MFIYKARFTQGVYRFMTKVDEFLNVERRYMEMYSS